MKCPISGLVTPIYVKTSSQTPWPAREKMFYLLAADGLFLCRNHQFFQSCVPAGSGPGELAAQEAFFDIQYPKVPRRLLELTVGFFTKVGKKYNAEAIVMLAWDNRKEQVYLIVPRQRSIIYQDYYGISPVGVEYEVPVNLPDDHFIFGDIHSHVSMAAFSSKTDKHDEKKRPGLHIVVGRIHAEPPEFHVEVIVDGVRFKVEKEMALEGYFRRAPISKKYLKQVEIKTLHPIQGYWINNENGKTDYLPFRDNYFQAVTVHNKEIVTIE